MITYQNGQMYVDYCDGINDTNEPLYAAMIFSAVEGLYSTYEEANKALAGLPNRVKLNVVLVPAGRTVDSLRHAP